ncbi:MAG: hypothetical protein Fur0021_06380 [Candidatus Promineifilaceae bacterium]
MSFHWQTEDNTDWDSLPPPSTPPSRRRSWSLALLFLGILAAGTITIWQQVTGRVEVVSETMHDEVTAAFWLARSAAARQDEELYLTLLSGREPAWTEAQMSLLAANQVGGRSLWDMPAAGDPHILDIALSPDLNTATVTVRQPLQTTLPDGRNQTITVHQIDVFRRGEERWLLAPPDAAFWELTERSRGRYLTLSFPQRDRAVAERLARDLETDLARLCAEVEACETLHLDVTLSPDLQSLVSQIDYVSRLQTDLQLLLPSPTLVGTPVDEAGYQALRRAYGARVAGTAINHLADYDCCAHASLYLALLDLPLQQLGLRPISLHPEDYAQLLEQDLNLLELLNNLRNAWLLSPDEETSTEFSPLFMQTFATFWSGQEATATYLAQLQQLASAPTFTTFTQQVGSTPQRTNNLGAAWFRFLFAQAQLAQTEPPIPLPGESVALLCSGLRGQTIYEYNLSQNEITRIQEMRTYGGYQILAHTPDGKGIIIPGLAGYDASGFPMIEVVSWSSGQLQRLFADPNASYYALAQYDPTGQYLALLSLSRDEKVAPSTTLLDLADCQTAGCAAQTLAGWPIWSPDGERTLLIDLNGRTWLGDAVGQSARLTPPNPNLGFSLAMAWLDNDRYVYAAPTNSSSGSSADIYSYTLTTGETELLAQTVDYVALLPASTPANSSQIIHMAAVPQQPQRLIFAANVGAITNSSQPTAVFSLDVSTRALELLYYEAATTAYPPFQISADGRWLTLLTYQRLNDAVSQLYLYDLMDAAAGQVIASGNYVAYDWDKNSQWLVVYDDQRLYALAPAFAYERLYVPGQEGCYDVAWQGADEG